MRQGTLVRLQIDRCKIIHLFVTVKILRSSGRFSQNQVSRQILHNIFSVSMCQRCLNVGLANVSVLVDEDSLLPWAQDPGSEDPIASCWLDFLTCFCWTRVRIWGKGAKVWWTKCLFSQIAKYFRLRNPGKFYKPHMNKISSNGGVTTLSLL